MKKIYQLTFILSLIWAFLSCDGQDKKDIYVPIKSLQATTSVNLGERTDWVLSINRIDYKTVVKGRTIHAKPSTLEDAACYVIYGMEALENQPELKPDPIDLLFASPNYPLKDVDQEIVSGKHTPGFELLDQSTYEKMMAMDALAKSYIGMFSPHLSNIKLEHRHSMLNFSIEGLPNHAKVSLLTSSEEIKPFEKEGVRSAILVKPLFAEVQVEAHGQTHIITMTEALKWLPVENRLSKDMCYSLILNYDSTSRDADKMLTIGSVAGNKWSAEDLEHIVPSPIK